LSAVADPFRQIHEEGFQNRANNAISRLQESNPELANDLAQHPALLKDQMAELRNRYNAQNQGFTGTMANLGNAVSFNPFKALGAQTYGSRMQDASVAGDRSISGFAPQVAQAVQQGQDPLSVPGLIDSIKAAPPEQQQFMIYQLQQLVDSQNRPQQVTANTAAQGQGPAAGSYQ
jgi:hypothetical protein